MGYYEATYDAPVAPELAAEIKSLMPASETVVDQPGRGLDHWAHETLYVGDLDQLMACRHRAPAARYAHPTADHFSPLFVVLGTADDPAEAAQTVIDGYWFGLAKRSVQVD